MSLSRATSPRPLRSLWPAALALCLGCAERGPDVVDPPPFPDSATFVPAGGTVRLNGAPLARAVITFLPETGAPGVAETDAEGKYALETIGSPGIPPGRYKVGVSYLLSAEGEPQGLGPRSAMSQPPGMLTAREALPATYADLGVTELSATVDGKGGTYDFDLKAELKVPTKARAAATPEPEAETPEPASGDVDAEPSK